MQIENINDTANNTISLCELFKNIMISLYKRRLSDVESEEIPNFDFLMYQLISDIKNDFKH